MQGPAPFSRLPKRQYTGRYHAPNKAAARQAALAQHRRAGQAHVKQVVYWPQFLDPEDFATVVKECNKLRCALGLFQPMALDSAACSGTQAPYVLQQLLRDEVHGVDSVTIQCY